MNTLNVDLENCYGIKKLKAQFDFSQHKAYAIYAPNGAMKTSLAQTFKDIADVTVSKDRIFPARVCTFAPMMKFSATRKKPQPCLWTVSYGRNTKTFT